MYNEAFSDYEKAITLRPSYAEAYTNRGSLYFNLNQVDKAIADYNRAIVLNPSQYAAYYNLGLIYGRTGFSDRAIAYFSKSLDANPELVSIKTAGCPTSTPAGMTAL
jgi:tetratricopeptide (TPR) repeat protein